MEGYPKNSWLLGVSEDNEKPCWGCGLRLLLPSYSPIFKCGWCGAITDEKELRHENKYFWCRRLRDRCFVCILFSFMLFVIFGGFWAVYPVVFSVSYFSGFVHSIITSILTISTLSTFSLAAFRCAGTPPIIIWGSYPVVGKGHLENYKFCHYCLKPKPPRAHHCRSCGMCILDMDHHCPFIGNCVGAANHRHFIAFLISTVISTIYVAIMSAYAEVNLWPPVTLESMNITSGGDSVWAWRIFWKIVVAFLSSAVFVSPRGLLLAYLFIASVSVNIGLSVLLWQQLSYIYEGNTYLSHISLQNNAGEKDCKNLLRFFGCPYSISKYLPYFRKSPKKHEK